MHAACVKRKEPRIQVIMPVLVDFHVLAQALVYFVSVACGLVISIPLGVTTVSIYKLLTTISYTYTNFICYEILFPRMPTYHLGAIFSICVFICTCNFHQDAFEELY